MRDGLIIDLDDTLVDSESAYCYALNKIGLSVTSSEYLSARAMVKRRLGDGHVAARNRFLYFKQMLLEQNRCSPSNLLQLAQDYEFAVIEHMKNQWHRLRRPALFETLANGYKIAIVTNENTRFQTSKIAAFDAEGRFFSHLITSEEIGEEKPSPRLFEEAVGRLSLSPEQCTAVGNSIKTDLVPAWKLGMGTVLTTEFQQDQAERYPKLRVISKLDQLRNWL